eukprot:12928206-Prorocentrum_lima.AAC.1
MNGGGCCGGGCCGIAISGIFWQTSGPQEPQYQTGLTPGGTDCLTLVEYTPHQESHWMIPSH